MAKFRVLAVTQNDDVPDEESFGAQILNSLGVFTQGLTDLGVVYDQSNPGYPRRAPPSPNSAPLDSDLSFHIGDKVNKHRNGIQKFLSKHHYYSYDLDISQTAQRHCISKTYEQNPAMPQSQGIPMLKEYLLGKNPDRASLERFNSIFCEKSLFDSFEMRYCWNESMVHPFKKANIDLNWVVPILQGSVSSSFTHVARKTQNLLESNIRTETIEAHLFTRRSRYRGGTRYYDRGISKDGDVANFCEIEMLVCLSRLCPNGMPLARLSKERRAHVKRKHGPDYVLDFRHGWASYVQIRGSVPLYWEQNMKQNPTSPPPIILQDTEATQPAYALHMDKLHKQYGDVFCMNLLSSHKGNEDRLTVAWREMNVTYSRKRREAMQAKQSTTQQRKGVPKLQGIPLVFDWDFHKDLRLMSFNEALENYWEEQGWQLVADRCQAFTQNSIWATKSIHKFQTGVIRTNCLDCLDRTNAFQYWSCWNWLKSHLSQRGFVEFTMDNSAIKDDTNKDTPITSMYFGGLDSTFQVSRFTYVSDKSPSNEMAHNPARAIVATMWADSGDRVSQLYTGTGSVITQLLKEGKASMNTRMTHGWRSITRLYQNAVEDHYRQEYINTILAIPKLSAASKSNELDLLLDDLDK